MLALHAIKKYHQMSRKRTRNNFNRGCTEKMFRMSVFFYFTWLQMLHGNTASEKCVYKKLHFEVAVWASAKTHKIKKVLGIVYFHTVQTEAKDARRWPHKIRSLWHYLSQRCGTLVDSLESSLDDPFENLVANSDGIKEERYLLHWFLEKDIWYI